MRGNEVKQLLSGIDGRTHHPEEYIGKRLWSRDGAQAGVITNIGLCRLEGCGGTALHVRWPDGRRTYPCAKGCTTRPDGDLQIA